jgi:hypothetical protein
MDRVRPKARREQRIASAKRVFEGFMRLVVCGAWPVFLVAGVARYSGQDWPHAIAMAVIVLAVGLGPAAILWHEWEWIAHGRRGGDGPPIDYR